MSAAQADLPVGFDAHPTGSSTLGLLGEGGLAHLLRSEAPAPPSDRPGEPALAFEIMVRGRRDADALAARLVEHVRKWDAAGRPTGAGLRIRAYPTANTMDAMPTPGPGGIVVQERHVTLILDWPPP
jgi:protein-L-isoaspartate(D-aspartate) O-methyltransferase